MSRGPLTRGGSVSVSLCKQGRVDKMAAGSGGRRFVVTESGRRTDGVSEGSWVEWQCMRCNLRDALKRCS